MRYLTVKEVIAINQFVISKYSPGEQIGVKDAGLLESAVMRLQTTVQQKDAYPSIDEKAAALFESLAQNHPFYNANKRTAFLSLTQFLSYNGYDFEMTSQLAQEDLTVNVVNHEIDFDTLVYIIRTNK